MSEPTSTPAPTSGNPTATPDPASTQAAATNANATPANQTPATSQAPEVKPEDLLSASRFQLSPTEELEQVKKQFSASSTEARRYKAALDTLEKEQGIKPVFDAKGAIKGWEPTDKYESDMPKLNLPKLTDSERELFAEDPEKAFEKYAARAGESISKALVRAKPTIDPSTKLPDALTPERIVEAVDYVGSRQTATGPKYENFAQIKPALSQMMNDPNLPEPIQAAIRTTPTFMAELLADRLELTLIRMQKSAASSQQTKDQRTQAAQRAAETLPSGTGTVTIGTGSKSEAAKAFVDQMNRSLAPAGAM